MRSKKNEVKPVCVDVCDRLCIYAVIYFVTLNGKGK